MDSPETTPAPEAAAASAAHTKRHRWLADVRDLFYPPQCVQCSNRLAESPAGPLLCAACREALFPEVPGWCIRCAAPQPPEANLPNCGYCRRDRFAFERTWSLGVYRGPLKSAVLAMKGRGSSLLSVALGEELARQAESRGGREGVDLIVPIPMHWLRRLWRGTNPAEELAEIVARRWRIPCEQVIRSGRRIPRQSRLAPSARRRNIRGAFSLARNYDINGARVLLIDDVMTTGATAHEAARTLRRAGAARITLAVAARGLGGSPFRADRESAPF